MYFYSPHPLNQAGQIEGLKNENFVRANMNFSAVAALKITPFRTLNLAKRESHKNPVDCRGCVLPDIVSFHVINPFYDLLNKIWKSTQETIGKRPQEWKKLRDNFSTQFSGNEL
jgi:hypothetical protein